MLAVTPLAIDLCCGLGGWTEGLLAEAWRVRGYDIEAHGCGDLGYTVEGGYRCCGGSDWECGASGCTGPILEEQQVECPCGILRGQSQGANQ